MHRRQVARLAALAIAAFGALEVLGVLAGLGAPGALGRLATTAAASPLQDLDRARQSFRQHDYESAMKLATYLLYPDEKLAAPADLVEAHVILGASNFETGRRSEARNEFEKALQIQPDKTLTDLLFSEGAIRLFDETKADLVARAERDSQLRKLAEERERIRKYKESLVVVEKRSFGVNFVPFGAGQFQNKQPVRGILFASGQGLTAGVSLGAFLYLAGKHGLSATVSVVDGPGIRQLQQLEIGAGIAFYLIYALGVVDALWHYKPSVQIEGDDSLLPPLRDPPEKPKKPPPKKTSLRDRLQIRPMITPDSAGLGLTWEND
jgi:tetratricopeptide (TPR) repeat protein